MVIQGKRGTAIEIGDVVERGIETPATITALDEWRKPWADLASCRTAWSRTWGITIFADAFLPYCERHQWYCFGSGCLTCYVGQK